MYIKFNNSDLIPWAIVIYLLKYRFIQWTNKPILVLVVVVITRIKALAYVSGFFPNERCVKIIQRWVLCWFWHCNHNNILTWGLWKFLDEYLNVQHMLYISDLLWFIFELYEEYAQTTCHVVLHQLIYVFLIF